MRSFLKIFVFSVACILAAGRASAAEEKEQLQRSLDRMRVEQDLRRIAWEKDYDAAVQLIREMRACLESVRNSLDKKKRCDVEDCLAKAASFAQ